MTQEEFDNTAFKKGMRFSVIDEDGDNHTYEIISVDFEDGLISDEFGWWYNINQITIVNQNAPECDKQ